MNDLGTTLTVTKDCRFAGCERGECVQQGPIYTCKQSEYSIYFNYSDYLVLTEISTFLFLDFESFFRTLFHIMLNYDHHYKLF